MAGPSTQRMVVFPDIATGLGAAVAAGGAVTWGVWVDVALLAAITQATSILGVAIDTPSAAEVFTIDIGSCAGFANAAALNGGGAPAIAAAHRVLIRYTCVSVVGNIVPIYFPVPVIIPAGVGIVARMYNVAGAATCNVSVICAQPNP